MKQWGSFQKQLNNYGFEKRDRSKVQGRYAHWDNRFWRGRRDLLPRVVRRPKALQFQDAVQERPLTPDTPPAASVVPQLPSQPDPYARIYYLEKRLETVDSELKATQARLGTMEAMVRQMSNELRALSIGNSSPRLQVPTEPAGGTLGTQYTIHGASYSSRIQTGITPGSLIGAQDGVPSQRTPSQPGPGMPYDSIIAHEPPPVYPQWPANASFAGPSRSLHHASGQPTVGVPFLQESWMQHGSADNVGSTFFNPGFGQQPYAGAPAGPQTFTPTTFITTPTNQTQFRPQGSNSPGTSGGRRQFGGTAPVPRPQARQGR
ncbi:hypothetical protein FRC04_003051 [Tulasnella sp. 424]|nr:hypothetical protein FRC04_003051 [Tulasnella sp. 424]